MVNGHETLYCTASGYPKPTLKWVFENKTVDQEDAKRGLSLGLDVIDSNQLTLTLNESPDTDDLSGTYSCVANNSEGRDSIDIPVKFMKSKYRKSKLILESLCITKHSDSEPKIPQDC